MKTSVLVIGGIRSGVGKTSVTLGIIRALASRGRRVAALKVGPDFLDPSHYTAAGASFVRNIDPLLQSLRGADSVRRAAERYDAVVVEGAMGLFDGPIPNRTEYSTAHIAKKFGWPVLLVSDGRSCAQSISAEIAGVRLLLGPRHSLKVILNFVGTPRHAQLLAAGAKKLAGVRVSGILYRDSLPTLPSRHLGLIPAGESRANSDVYAAFGKTLSALPLDKWFPRKNRRFAAPASASKQISSPRRGPIVAIARDSAFNFYYPETIEFFQNNAARVVFFSPMRDSAPPPADLYYFGGGFPEVFAESLAKNSSFRKAMGRALKHGAKAYAECGGLMYLSKKIITSDGRSFPMTGILPGNSRMHKRRQALGYWSARPSSNILFLKRGMKLIGHEYHWSSFESAKTSVPIFLSKKVGSHEFQKTGWVEKNVLASYLHLSPLGNRKFFIEMMRWVSVTN